MSATDSVDGHRDHPITTVIGMRTSGHTVTQDTRLAEVETVCTGEAASRIGHYRAVAAELRAAADRLETQLVHLDPKGTT